MTNRTLLTGWWGPVSFFANFSYLGRNLLTGRRLRYLDSPHTPPSDSETNLRGPLDPGKPLNRRSGPWFVAILTVLVIGGGVAGALGSAQRGEGGALARGGTLPVTQLREGDCFDDPEGGETKAEINNVRAVLCAETHDNEVFATGSVPAPTDAVYPATPNPPARNSYGRSVPAPTDAVYPGDDELFEQVGLYCLQEFEAFVGKPYDDSILDITVVTPTAESWRAGDRDYICAVYDVTGSVRGSLRGVRR
ncbi:MAG: septum formation family protein [Thermoanaerobaculia bacterium]